MTKISALFFLLLNTHVIAGNKQDMPPEVVSFIEERDICEHFLGEPYEGEGASAEMEERREFIFESYDIYCAGTDRRLAALRKRYKANPKVLERLNKYEEKIEAN
jgi:hypothetical protein